MATILDAVLSHDDAVEIVGVLSEKLMLVPMPTVVFDSNMDAMPAEPGTRFIAYCYPLRNEIHFRAEYIPYNSAFHEFGHIYYTAVSGSTDKVKSEEFAQHFAAMSLTQGEQLLNFSCSDCNGKHLMITPDWMFQCTNCGALYALEAY